MNKKILVIYYSQSGQLGDIITNFTHPLIEAGNTVEFIRVTPIIPYPFPWSGKNFFAQMPDCVLQVPTQLHRLNPKETNYDLVIIGYQAWFLSPSIPVNSFLNNTALQNVVKNTPVITITGARNMWISAMEDIKVLLKNAKANLVANIVLVDKHANFVSFVTILYWMFTAKRDRYLNLFPTPGVAKEDIINTKKFGSTVQKYLLSGNWDGLQKELVEQEAVVVKYNLMYIESKAKKIFGLWAGFISKRKRKTPWLVAFKYYLLIALFIAAPIILTVDAIFFKPFLKKRILQKKQYFLDVK